jgi:hypothetical protein
VPQAWILYPVRLEAEVCSGDLEQRGQGAAEGEKTDLHQVRPPFNESKK